jgi:hypothetical protein
MNLRISAMTGACVATLALPALGAASSKDQGISSSTASDAQFASINTADIPGRCPVDHFYLDDFTRLDWKRYAQTPSTGDADDEAIDAMLSNVTGDAPTIETYFMKKTDYYERRRAMQAKVEARLGKLSGAELEKGLDNYAYLLGYLGEFKKLVKYFGPHGPAERPKDGIIALALAHDYFRLGLY